MQQASPVPLRITLAYLPDSVGDGSSLGRVLFSLLPTPVRLLCGLAAASATATHGPAADSIALWSSAGQCDLVRNGDAKMQLWSAPTDGGKDSHEDRITIRNGRVSLLFRINEVTSKHNNRNFCLHIAPDLQRDPNGACIASTVR